MSELEHAKQVLKTLAEKRARSWTGGIRLRATDAGTLCCLLDRLISAVEFGHKQVEISQSELDRRWDANKRLSFAVEKYRTLLKHVRESDDFCNCGELMDENGFCPVCPPF